MNPHIITTDQTDIMPKKFTVKLLKNLGETFSYKQSRARFVCMSHLENESNDFCSSPRVNFLKIPIFLLLPLSCDMKGSSGCCSSVYLYSRLMSSYSVNVVLAYNRANNSSRFIWCRQDLWKLNEFDIWAICRTYKINQHKYTRKIKPKSPVRFCSLWFMVYT